MAHCKSGLRRGALPHWLLAGLILSAASTAQAEHADITLLVIQSDAQLEATDDTEPPVGGLNKTPVFDLKAGEPATMQFIFVNTYPHRELPGVSVRYYVTPLTELRQKETPSPDDGHAILRGQITLPLQPQCRVGARLQFTLPQPGFYRMRIDTLHTQSDHEHFSAIDLNAE